MSHTYTSKPSQARAGRGGGTSGRGRGTAPRSTATNPSSRNSNMSFSGPGYQSGAGYNGGFQGGGARPKQREHPPLPPGQGRGDGSQQNTESEEKVQHASGYTVIKPNEKKRQQIQAQAKKETREYEKFKAKNKLKSVSEVGTPGGGLITQQQARQKQQTSLAPTPTQRKLKTQQYRTAEKERENAQYDQKKAIQRKKTEENRIKEERREEKLKEDHRRKNAAFLDRLEGKG